MSVVGIDFGNLNTVVAVARNRGIDVIVNEVSNRATPSLVSFGEKQRYLGESAKTQEISNFKNTVSSLKRIIGRPFNDPDIMGTEKKYVNCNLLENEEDGQIQASVMHENEMKEFSFTQLVAMYFSKVKEFTQNEIKLPVSDVVISVPGWFTDHQRRAIQDAAEIAQLNCLRIMNDLTAAALGYGITKLDLPDPSVNPSAKPRHVCFVDMGHSSYQVSVVDFTKGKLVVKGAAYDRNLGGRNFDDILVDHYTKEFSTKYKLDIPSNKKAMFRLRIACERVKKVLSANAVTVLNIECLMDDKDVSAQVERVEFEKWVEPLINRLTATLEKAIQLSGVPIEEIDAVELIGGSTRIPLVKDVLAKFFGGNAENNKLSTTLNQDEAVAKGCALQCAIISPVFKVRDFSVSDWNAYPVQLSWDPSIVPHSKSGSVDYVMDAFPLNNVIPSTKMLTLTRVLSDQELASNGGSVNFDITANYTDEIFDYGAPAGHGKRIGVWTVKGIKKIQLKDGETIDESASGKATIKVKAKLDGNGVIVIEGAQQVEDVTVTYTEQPPKKEVKAEEKKEGEAAGAEKTDMDTSAEVTDAKAEEQETAPAEPIVKSKKVTRKYDLEVVAKTSAASRELIAKLQSAEGQMYAADRLVIDTAEKRNALEEYVYDTRSKLEMAWSEYVADEVKSEFMKQLNDMENWLYTEEGEEASKSVYVEKLNGLKKLGDPIALRYRECELRPVAEKEFREYVNSVIVNLTAGDDRYSHIAQDELEKVQKECNVQLDWLNDSIAKQNDKPKHANLVVTSEEILKTKKNLEYFVNPILSKPKPKVEKKKEEDTKSEETVKDEDMSEETPVKEKKDVDMEVD